MCEGSPRLALIAAACGLLALGAAGCGLLGGRRPAPAEARYERRLDEGRDLARRGRMAEAAEAFEDATYAEPEAAEGHLLLAHALVELGQGYRALDELQVAERLRPGYGPQRILLGRVLTELGRLDEARPVLTAAVADWPDDATAQYAMGLLRLREDRLEEAELHLTRALRLAPRHLGALEAAGRVLLRLGRTEDAADRFEQATRLADCDDLAYGGLAAAQVVLGRPAQGQTSFQEALRCARSGQATPWRAGLALAFAADGRHDLARGALAETGTFFAPPFRSAMEERLERAGAGFREAGCDAHEMVCRQASERLWSGALLLFVLGAADTAEREIQRSIELYDGDPMAHWALAEALAELGRPMDARLELERAAAWEPGAALRAAMDALGAQLRERIEE